MSHAVRRSRKWRPHTRRVRAAWRPRRSKSGGTLNHTAGEGHSNPHRATSPSVSIRSPGLTVHCLSRRRSWLPFSGASCHVLALSAFSGHPLLMMPAFCHYYSNVAFGDPRSGTGTRSGGDAGSPSALASHPSRVPRIHDTARRIRDRLPPWLTLHTHSHVHNWLKRCHLVERLHSLPLLSCALLEPTPQLAPLLRGQLPCPRIVRVLRTSILVDASLLSLLL